MSRKERNDFSFSIPFYDRWCIRKFNECIDRQHGNAFLNSFK